MWFAEDKKLATVIYLEEVRRKRRESNEEDISSIFHLTPAERLERRNKKIVRARKAQEAADRKANNEKVIREYGLRKPPTKKG